jgi:hypothetical protein
MCGKKCLLVNSKNLEKNGQFVTSCAMQIGVVCVLVLVFVSTCLAADPNIPFVYPLYKQCDPRWGNDLMGGSG